MRVLVTGATGFLGRHLLDHLERPVVLSRNPQRVREELGAAITAYAWDPLEGPPPREALQEVDAVVHLAGEPIAARRWTAAQKQRIRESRFLGTRHLVDGLLEAGRRPACLISASAVGYYGHRGDERLTERSSPGTDFLAEICAQWEAESQRAATAGIRVVNPRIGVVLGPKGGALSKMLTPFKLGLGGRLGSGRQYMSWIHVDDLSRLLLLCVEHSELAGPVNAVSPQPVTNREFTRTLGQVLHRPTVIPVPGFLLRAAFGEMASVLLDSQRVVPERAERLNFQYEFADLPEALRQIIKEW